jgi:hypothetical protein
MLAKMGINQAKTEAAQEEINAKMDMHKERMEAAIHSMRHSEETTACQETTEACLEYKEPTSEEMKSGAVHREVLKEHAAVKPVGGLGKRHRCQHLAARRRGQPEERTRENWSPPVER